MRSGPVASSFGVDIPDDHISALLREGQRACPTEIRWFRCNAHTFSGDYR